MHTFSGQKNSGGTRVNILSLSFADNLCKQFGLKSSLILRLDPNCLTLNGILKSTFYVKLKIKSAANLHANSE